MSNKELILKRLLENKHITIEEMFILNEKENKTVVIKDFTPIKITDIGYPDWTWRPEYAPYYLSYPNTIFGNSNTVIPSDYKMD